MLKKIGAALEDDFLYARGILSKRYAYKGPHFLSFHISDSCNLNCAGCRSHSYLLTAPLSQEKKNLYLEPKRFFRAVDEAVPMKIRDIILSGDGEPFMHPDIYSFVKYVKQKKIRCTVLTNGTLIDERALSALSSLRCDILVISLWDCDSQRYGELRPGHAQGIENIIRLLEVRKRGKAAFPAMGLDFAFHSGNFQAVAEMVAFARRYRVNRVTFKLLEVDRLSDGAMGPFTLSQDQIDRIGEQLQKISQEPRDGLATNIHHFLRFLRGVRAHDGLYLNDSIKELPCYIGWFYMGVLTDGTVYPCGGCRGRICGNIFEIGLKEIWDSDTYQRFRHDALLHKGSGLFDAYGCGRICMHYQANLKLNRYFGPIFQKRSR